MNITLQFFQIIPCEVDDTHHMEHSLFFVRYVKNDGIADDKLSVSFVTDHRITHRRRRIRKGAGADKRIFHFVQQFYGAFLCSRSMEMYWDMASKSCIAAGIKS